MGVVEKDPFEIYIGMQRHGFVFRLRPKSRQRLEEEFPSVPDASSVTIGYDTKRDFERVHGAIWQQVVMLLTGLSLEKLNAAGGCLITVPGSGKVVYDSRQHDAEDQ